MSHRICGGALVAALIAAPSAAFAQDGERGVRLGALSVMPELSVEYAESDNLLRQRVGRDGSEWRVRASVNAETTWSRHQIKANAFVEDISPDTGARDDRTNASAGVEARLDVARASSVTAGVQWTEMTEDPGSVGANTLAAGLTQYEEWTYRLGGVAEFTRVRLGVGYNQTERDYDDVARIGGGVIDQDARDIETGTVTVRGDYAMSPGLAVFAEASRADTEYLRPTPGAPSRDAETTTGLVGVSFFVSELIDGELAVGYSERDVASPVFRDESGFSVRGFVDWSPREWVKVRASAARLFTPSAISGAATSIDTRAGVALDYELRRNILASLALDWTTSEYVDFDREDERFSAILSATYKINRIVGVTFGVQELNFDSTGAQAGVSFDETRVFLRLVFQI